MRLKRHDVMGVYRFTKRMFARDIAVISAVMLAASSIFFLNSRQLIPQVPATTFAVFALAALYAALDKGSAPLFAISGLFSALAALSHPLGSVVFFAASLICLCRKRLFNRNYALYVTVFIALLLPYIFYVTSNLGEYRTQVSVVTGQIYDEQNILLNMLDEIPVRFFKLSPVRYLFEKGEIAGVVTSKYVYNLKWLARNLDLKVYACSISSAGLFLLSFIYIGLKRRRSKSESELFLITAVFFLVLGLHPNKYPAYIYVVSPYIAICLAIWIRDLYAGIVKRRLISFIASAAVLLFILALILSNLVFIYKAVSNKRFEDYSLYMDKVRSYIPSDSVVAGPAYFWPGMQKDNSFISTNEIVYRLDSLLREEEGSRPFFSLPESRQEALISRILMDYKIRYFLLTCHEPEEITEAPGLAGGEGYPLTKALRKYLFYNAEKEADFLRKNYYRGESEAADFDKERYNPPPGTGFYNVTAEYQNSLKVYKLK